MSVQTALQGRPVFSLKKYAYLPTLLLVASTLILLLTSITLSSNGFWIVNTLKLQSVSPGERLAQSQLAFMSLRQITTWQENVLFVAAFSLLFLLYFLSLRLLPRMITSRYIVSSTLLLGLCYLLIPIVTSQDIFSYIAYARMDALYHVNPFTMTPEAIKGDAIYHLLYWTHQPSIYGPTWILVTVGLQRVALLPGFRPILVMQLLLRLWGLAMHVGSLSVVIALLRQLCCGDNSGAYAPPETQHTVLRASLAFAWNPFLLLEACINAHNDTTILFLVLLALYFVSLKTHTIPRSYLLAAALLGIATCLKVTILILFPGFLLFLWVRPQRELVRGTAGRSIGVLASICAYGMVLLLLYLPFWQDGALMHIFQVTPGTTRDINSIYEFLVRTYAHISGMHIAPDTMDKGSWVEAASHQVSLVIFVIIYAVLWLRSFLAPHCITTLPALIRWMAGAWFFYCFLGSPWFWPWYMITFLGLTALLEPVPIEKPVVLRGSPLLMGKAIFSAIFARALSASMLSMYCFAAWPTDARMAPFLPHIRWMYLRGLLIWIPPFLALYIAIYLLPTLYNKQRAHV